MLSASGNEMRTGIGSVSEPSNSNTFVQEAVSSRTAIRGIIVRCFIVFSILCGEKD